MIIAQVRFPRSEPISLEDVTEIFRSTAPKYKGRQGLQKKMYTRSEDGMTVGALYFWESRADAEATYTDDWRAMVTDKYGAAPVITFFDAPVIVDNLEK
ncbi:MAG: monooxygenase [Hyphomicrobiaceae bacterium]